MKYFNNINSLGDLKKQYRLLALENHPDKGGSIEKMQEINNEFEKLFVIWNKKKSDNDIFGNTDYSECKTAREYTSHVYDEYRWKGSRVSEYRGLKELGENVRQWLKATYPNTKWSVTTDHLCIYVRLMAADFEVFKTNGYNGRELNQYRLDREDLTDMGFFVWDNVIKYVSSFNYDRSDPMVDYFDTNFYMHFRVGSHDKDFELTKNRCSGKTERVRLTPTEKKLQRAIGNGNKVYNIQYLEKYGKHWYICAESDHPYPLYLYSNSLNPAIKRIAELKANGFSAHYEGGIIIDGYDEILKQIESERAEMKNSKPTPAEKIKSSDVEILDYSEKAIAVVGDTKKYKDILKQLGGKFNNRLSCGCGWIFPKSKREQILRAIA